MAGRGGVDADFDIDIDKAAWKRLEKALLKLPEKIVKKVFKGAVQDAMEPLLAAARRHRRRTARGYSSGLLERSLVNIVKRFWRSNNTVAFVTPDPGVGGVVTYQDPETGRRRQREEYPAWIAHLVEGGTQPHSVLKGASIRVGRGQWFGYGRMHPGARPSPFIYPAYYETKDKVARRARANILAGVGREAGKLGLGPS